MRLLWCAQDSEWDNVGLADTHGLWGSANVLHDVEVVVGHLLVARRGS